MSADGAKSAEELVDSLEEMLMLHMPPGSTPPVRTGTCKCGVDLFDNVTRCGLCEYRRECRARARQAIVDRALEWIPRRYHWASFDAPELAQRVKVPAAIAKAKAAIGEERVVLLGPAGAGKTVLATVLALTHAKAGREVIFADALQLAVARSQHGLGDGEAPRVESAIEADVLVLDDLGAERAAPNSPIADIIHARHGAESCTIATSGFRPEQLEERYGSGIARRLFEGATIIDLAKGAR